MKSKKENLLDTMKISYLDRIGYHVEQDNYSYADAIYEEFVIDGKDPDEEYEWLFIDYIDMK